MTRLEATFARLRERGERALVTYFMAGDPSLADTRRMFAETFHAFAGQVHPGDVLAVAWISDRSASELRLPIKHEFPPPDTAGRNAHYRRLVLEASRKQTAQAAESLATRFDSMLEDTTNAAPGTDILGSLELAKRVFSLYPNTVHILLVMSDMRETSRIAGLGTLAMKGVDSLIFRLRSDGRGLDPSATISEDGLASAARTPVARSTALASSP